jgi:hypothetical protein
VLQALRVLLQQDLRVLMDHKVLLDQPVHRGLLVRLEHKVHKVQQAHKGHAAHKALLLLARKARKVQQVLQGHLARRVLPGQPGLQEQPGLLVLKAP